VERKLYIYIILFQHETLQSIVNELKSVVPGGIDLDNAEIIMKARKPEYFPDNCLIISDSIIRFGNSADKASRFLNQILADSNREIWLPNLDLRRSNDNFFTLLQMIVQLADIKRLVKSAHIKQSLHIRTIVNGKIHDQKGISEELKQIVLAEYQRCGLIRKTARTLSENGHRISPSSVSRIVSATKKDKS